MVNGSQQLERNVKSNAGKTKIHVALLIENDNKIENKRTPQIRKREHWVGLTAPDCGNLPVTKNEINYQKIARENEGNGLTINNTNNNTEVNILEYEWNVNNQQWSSVKFPSLSRWGHYCQYRSISITSDIFWLIISLLGHWHCHYWGISLLAASYHCKTFHHLVIGFDIGHYHYRLRCAMPPRHMVIAWLDIIHHYGVIGCAHCRNIICHAAIIDVIAIIIFYLPLPLPPRHLPLIIDYYLLIIINITFISFLHFCFSSSFDFTLFIINLITFASTDIILIIDVM